MRTRLAVSALALFALLSVLCLAQTEEATISGRVTDQTGAIVVGARVQLLSAERGTTEETITNGAGIYLFPTVHPGVYHITVRKEGFHQVDYVGLTANVEAHIEQNFKLQVGSVSESTTVRGSSPLVDTESAAVSTVVDRNFAENLPMNGRSFQTLIELTPGVVLTPNNGYDTGQFSVNGQRATSNYWTVDGAGANIGISAGAFPGNGMGGALGSTSVLGGTNSLVSVDALQEFRVQTSTYAPEFGRTPGGQISIVTRSGTNQFHGTAFDYLRNDVLDANDWFADFAKLPKPEERQNDFGGTIDGPILKDKTFFFFSYEGLRLRLPQTTLTYVPDTNPQDPYSRQFALPALLPYLNAFPRPNGPELLDPSGNHQGIAEFNASYSDRSSLDAYSVRIDHKLTERINLFGRYNYSPSDLSQRGEGGVSSLNTLGVFRITTTTGTVGMTWTLSPLVADGFRFNYSSTAASSVTVMDNFGGAVAITTPPFPSGFTSQNANFFFSIFSLGTYLGPSLGANANNRQRQINLVDSLSTQRSLHGLKLGIDYQRLSPEIDLRVYSQQPIFADVPSALTGSTFFNFVSSETPVTPLFRNLGLYAQDTWRALPRLTLTYGVRWDVDFAPSTVRGPKFPGVTGFNLSNMTNLALASAGTPPYQTRYGNVAPRVGLAYELMRSHGWQTVLRGGFGFFYDLRTSEAGNILGLSGYPFVANVFPVSNFPLTPAAAAPPPILPPSPSNPGAVAAFDPNLHSPYTLQWNVAVEQTLGRQQTLTASYVGSVGRRLLQTAAINLLSPSISNAYLVTDVGTSDYDALQIQFQRHLSHGFQVLASYTWSHSIDTASAGSAYGNGANALTPLTQNTNRGPSDFDVRNAFSAGLTADLPNPKTNVVMKAILGGWSTENFVLARSAPPVDVYYSGLGVFQNGFYTNIRPDLVVGPPLYLYGSQYPGGKSFNAAAFTPPLTIPGTTTPLSEGDLPRNALRAFGVAQWDFAVHRDFPLHEAIKLQFRAEMFNVLNHPNFGPPSGDLGTPQVGTTPPVPNPQFGLSRQMLGQSLSGGNLGAGAFNPLYQVGGPRSIQFALKLTF